MARRDTMKPFRLAIFNLLNGNISCEIYDEKKKSSDSNGLYVTMGTQTENQSSQQTDTSWMHDVTLDLEIIQKTGMEVSKDDIDDVSEEIYEILEPVFGTGALVIPGFQVTDLRVSGVSRTFEVSATESIVTKTCTISALLTQQL